MSINPQHWDGYRAHTISRVTGTTVVLVDGPAQGICDDDDNRWWLICDDHGTTCSWERQNDARSFMAYPHEWCDDCRNAQDATAVCADAWCRCDDCADTTSDYRQAMRDIGCTNINGEHTGGGCMWLAGHYGTAVIAVTGGTERDEAWFPCDPAACVVGIYLNPDTDDEAIIVDTDLASFVTDVQQTLAELGITTN